jgi:sugar O-acyltransferase (sialic acid O-acetyltransferase NeuD family)
MIKSTITIDKTTVSDTQYTITEVLVPSGSKVTKSQTLFTFETSKSIVDVEAPEDGYLYHKLDNTTNVIAGQVVAFISDDENLDIKVLFAKEHDSFSNSLETYPDIVVSAKAAKLIEENNIDMAKFTGRNQIKEKDVQEYLASSSSLFSAYTRSDLNDIIIIGAKGGCKMVIEAIRSTNHFTIKGIIDTEIKAGEVILGVPVLGNESQLETLYDQGYRNIVISFTSLNDLVIREEKYLYFKKMGFSFPNIVHCRATVEPSVKMGEGNIILANSMLGSDVLMGNVNFVNTGAMICHDTEVNQNNHFAPNAVLAGRIKVGRNNIFGMCSTTYFDIKVGNGNIINNGVNVFNNIADNKTIRN